MQNTPLPPVLYMVFIQRLFLLLVLLIPAVLWAADAEITALQNDASQAALQGDFEVSVSQWLELAELRRQQGNRLEESKARAYAAESSAAMGRYADAVRQLELALSLSSDADAAWRATVMGALGGAYLSAGSTEQAQQVLDDGLAIARSLKQSLVEAPILNNLGNLHASMRDYRTAADYYARCLDMAAKTGNHLLAAKAAVNAARMSVNNDRFSEARNHLAAATREAESLPASHDKAYLLIRNARLQREISVQQGGEDANYVLNAHGLLSRAAKLAESIGDRRATSYALGYLAQLYEEQQRYDEALTLSSKADFSIQKIHAPEVQYLWQWQSGRILAAQGKTSEAISAYRQAVKSIQTIRGELDVDGSEAAAGFRKDAAPVFLELADLLFKESEHVTKQQEQDYLVEARETVELMKAAEIQDYFGDDCVTRVREKIKGLDETITSGTAVLYPIVFEDRTELLLSLPSGLQRVSVGVGRKTLVSEVSTFRRNLEKRTTRQYLRQARSLYDWIIRPLEPWLEQNKTRVLVLVPDASLRTVPLSALNDGKQFLVQKYAVATTPSMRLTDPRPINRENVNLLLTGLSVEVDNFPALLNVESELDAIESIYGGKRLQNEQFNKARLQEELTNNEYSIVHLATHGKFSGKVKDSFVLTYDGRLSMDELEQFIGISWFREDNPVELLTLSACETAVGDDLAALGLASVAIKAGARSALASLWSINDEASSMLVSDFYRELQDPANTKAEALQQAQLKLLADVRYRHPAYWAPFLLIGNWL